MNVKLNFETLGIIDGDQKRMLENYIDERLLTQRKRYDEYYIMVSSCEISADINDLMILAEKFKVTVLENHVEIS